MYFNPNQIQAMREALFTIEQTLRFSTSIGIDEETRLELARAVLDAVEAGHTNPLVIASMVLDDLDPRSAA